MWWYVCEKCVEAVGGTYRERIPDEVVEGWLKHGDPRGLCELCGENPSRYYVEGEASSFNPEILRRHGIHPYRN